MLWLLVSAALAGTDAYQACCNASNAGACPSELQVAGPGSTAAHEGGAVRLIGVWRLNCTGQARFDSTATQVTSRMPADGTVLTPMGSSAAACFEAACSVPAALCVSHDGDRARVSECVSGGPADETLWQTMPVEDTRAVVMMGRVIVAKTGKPAAAPPPVQQATVYTAGRPADVVRAPAAAAVVGSVDKSALDLTIPPAPPDPCRVNATLMEASSQQVDLGNEAVMVGDLGGAVAKYRAAITINQCNPFAWADMGEAFLGLQEHARARTALEIATRLMPTHYQAWTNLGRAEEALGRKDSAASAYRKALDARPGHPPADEGLQRTRAR